MYTDAPEVSGPPPNLKIDGVNFAALYRAIENSYKTMEWARTLNANLIKEFHGPAYGGRGGADKPLNKMNQLVEAYTMLTAANRPKVQIKAKHKSLRWFERTFQESINNMTGEIGLEATIREWILNAFFLVGVVKVHRDKYRMAPFGGDMSIDPGIPSASNVPLDDWVYDTTAKKWPQIKYCADKYRVPFAWIEAGVNEGMYDKAVADQLRPTSKSAETSDRVDQISRGEVTDDDELEPMVDLADVWLHSTGKIYTCAVDDCANFRLKKLPPLGSFEWRDPDNPPHHILGFSDVPHNIMPLSPASHLDVLDRRINSTARKAIDQIERQKEVPVFTPAGADTARNIKNAADGVMVRGDLKEYDVHRSGGLDPNTYQALIGLNEFFNMQSGNLDTLMGTGTSAGTVGQEQLINTAANRKVGQLQGRVVEAATKLLRSLGFMLWEDSFHQFVNEQTVAGYTSDQDVWKPYEREGNFLDYNFAINVYSMTYNPPAMQAELLMNVVERLFAPMMDMIIAQGGQIDFEALASNLSGLLDLPVLEDVIKFAMPTENEESKPTDKLKSSVSHRKYTRESVSRQGDSQSRLQQTLQMMQSGAQQQPMQGAMA
jgi:hypothetical protein